MQLPDGTIITEQRNILSKIKDFYNNLFKCKDSDVDLSDKIANRASKMPFKELGYEISSKDLGNVLK